MNQKTNNAPLRSESKEVLFDTFPVYSKSRSFEIPRIPIKCDSGDLILKYEYILDI